MRVGSTSRCLSLTPSNLAMFCRSYKKAAGKVRRVRKEIRAKEDRKDRKDLKVSEVRKGRRDRKDLKVSKVRKGRRDRKDPEVQKVRKGKPEIKVRQERTALTDFRPSPNGTI